MDSHRQPQPRILLTNLWGASIGCRGQTQFAHMLKLPLPEDYIGLGRNAPKAPVIHFGGTEGTS